MNLDELYTICLHYNTIFSHAYDTDISRVLPGSEYKLHKVENPSVMIDTKNTNKYKINFSRARVKPKMSFYSDQND